MDVIWREKMPPKKKASSWQNNFKWREERDYILFQVFQGVSAIQVNKSFKLSRCFFTSHSSWYLPSKFTTLFLVYANHWRTYKHRYKSYNNLNILWERENQCLYYEEFLYLYIYLNISLPCACRDIIMLG